MRKKIIIISLFSFMILKILSHIIEQQDFALAESKSQWKDRLSDGTIAAQTEYMITEPPNRVEENTSDLRKSRIKTGTLKQIPLIVLSTSLARSGSTLFAEILSSKKGSILFFEPLHPKFLSAINKTTSDAGELFTSLLNCDILEKQAYIIKHFYFHQLSENAANCKAAACRNAFNITSECLNGKSRIIKTIRARMSDLEDLIVNSTYDIKVIHLARDPRGALTSIRRFNWDSTPSSNCLNQLDDMIECEKMSVIYPDNVMCLQYETAVTNTSIIHDMVKFAYGENTIPSETQVYIDKHLTSDVSKTKKAMSTYSISQRQYESWRYKIGPKFLKEVEDDSSCQAILSKMKYRLFHNQITVENRSIPLFI